MKNKMSYILCLGLLIASPALADPLLPIKVNGTLEVKTASGNEAEFKLGEPDTREAENAPSIQRFNTDQYDQNDCAVKIAKQLKEWDSEGIYHQGLQDAIDEYNAQVDDLVVVDRSVNIEARFFHKLQGMEIDGSRRKPTIPTLSYFDLVMGLSAGADIHVDASPSGKKKDYCDQGANPEIVIERLVRDIKTKTEGQKRARERRRVEDIRKKNQERIRGVEFENIETPSAGSAQ